MAGWAALLVWLSTACMPFAVPPLRLRAAAGPTTQAPPEPTQDTGDRAVTQLSAAFHPLQLVRRTSESPIDFGVGYQLEIPPEGARGTLHGAELELGWYPLSFDVNGTNARVGPITTTEMLVLRDEPNAPTGYGASLGLAIELTGYTAGGFSQQADKGAVVGVAAGQWALGMYAAAATRSVGRERYWLATVGVSGRIPFLLGVACCAVPEELGNSSSSDTSSDSESDADQPSSSTHRARRKRAREGAARPARVRAQPTPKR
jgi:hypothetical protein